MLRVFMLSVIMLNVRYKPFVMNVVRLSVVAPGLELVYYHNLPYWGWSSSI